jgi:hypothetical protein
MTEEEYDKLDEFWIVNTPEVSINGTGLVSRKNAAGLGLDDLSTDYLVTKARAINKTPAEILNDLVHQQIAQAS